MRAGVVIRSNTVYNGKKSITNVLFIFLDKIYF